MNKTCCMCKKSIPIVNFKSNKKRKDGLQTQCIECHKKYRREHYLKNRQKYIKKAAVWNKNFKQWWREYKSQYSCVKCGESHPACIQFHHHNDDKEGNVSEFVILINKTRLLKEVKKCIPLCANCHFKLHWDEKFK